MTQLKQWQIIPGTIYISGTAAPQGTYLPGGQIQKFIYDPWSSLK